MTRPVQKGDTRVITQVTRYTVCALSEGDDEWRATHLFPLERALFLAQQAAATVTVNGFTADRLVAWRRDPIRRARENGAASTPHLIDTPGASQ
jgi:ribosomal protein L15E